MDSRNIRITGRTEYRISSYNIFLNKLDIITFVCIVRKYFENKIRDPTKIRVVYARVTVIAVTCRSVIFQDIILKNLIRP